MTSGSNNSSGGNGYRGRHMRNGFQCSGLEEAEKLLQPTSEDILVDVACSRGETALYFAPLVRNVVASDISMKSLKRAQEVIAEEGGIENVTFREADAQDLPFPSGSFTLLTCRMAAHHFEDLPRALSEFHRVLRRQGSRMAIIDHLFPEDPEIAEFYQTLEKLRDPTHIRAQTKSGWEKLLGNTRFALEKTIEFPIQHSFQDWTQAADLNDDACSRLNDLLMDAPPKIHDYFEIESFAGEVENFSETALLLYATRLEAK